jgi:hypothetical protein
MGNKGISENKGIWKYSNMGNKGLMKTFIVVFSKEYLKRF